MAGKLYLLLEGLAHLWSLLLQIEASLFSHCQVVRTAYILGPMDFARMCWPFRMGRAG